MSVTAFSWDVWNKYQMALDALQQRMQRITTAFHEAGVPYAIVGGQAVILWVSTKDPDAVRTTKDVDILVDRSHLPQVRKAGLAVEMDYCEVLGVGMLLERANPNPKRGVHLLWANEKVRPDSLFAAPNTQQIQIMPPGIAVLDLLPLVMMKLEANRDHDRVHLRDMIDVGLIEREMMAQLPEQLAARLEPLLTAAGK